MGRQLEQITSLFHDSLLFSISVICEGLKEAFASLFEPEEHQGSQTESKRDDIRPVQTLSHKHS